MILLFTFLHIFIRNRRAWEKMKKMMTWKTDIFDQSLVMLVQPTLRLSFTLSCLNIHTFSLFFPSCQELKFEPLLSFYTLCHGATYLPIPAVFFSKCLCCSILAYSEQILFFFIIHIWNEYEKKFIPWQCWSVLGQPIYGGFLELVHI